MLSANSAERAQSYNEVVAAFDAEPVCLQSLFSEQPLEQLDAGATLFFEGDQSKHLFELVEGFYAFSRSWRMAGASSQASSILAILSAFRSEITISIAPKP